jgi:hypothetical protein
MARRAAPERGSIEDAGRCHHHACGGICPVVAAGETVGNRLLPRTAGLRRQLENRAWVVETAGDRCAPQITLSVKNHPIRIGLSRVCPLCERAGRFFPLRK